MYPTHTTLFESKAVKVIRAGSGAGPGFRRPRGFALVVTLSLLILLTVIAVGLLSLSAVSLRSSSHGMAQSEAQANARLALMIAIGELQKQLGPDQRISVTADQRIQSGGDGSVTSSAPGNRQWTGVFESWPATSDIRPTPVFRNWLVSGDPARLAQVNAAETQLTGADAIELVGAGTMGSAGTGEPEWSKLWRLASPVAADRGAWRGGSATKG